MSFFSSNLDISVFGESHGECVGCVIGGLPAGLFIDNEKISQMLSRRSARHESFATPRHEADDYEIISGIYNGFTNGAPLCAITRNKAHNSSDYDDMLHALRPSHADFAAYKKFGKYCDLRGGGHFSGRLTSPVVFAGAICKQLLEASGVYVASHVLSIGGAADMRFDPVNVSPDDFAKLDPLFPLIDESCRKSMLDCVEAARACGNSVGGTVECAAVGMPAGLGDTLFRSTESILSQLIFAIPGVKAVEFGLGRDISSMNGSDANDAFFMDENGAVQTLTNNSGGINGGLTNGMPIIVTAAFRPVPTIALRQRTIDIIDTKNTSLCAHGRHDACILPRGAVAIEAAVCIGLYDIMLSKREERL